MNRLFQKSEEMIQSFSRMIINNSLVEEVQHGRKRWVHKHPYLSAFILSMIVAVLLSTLSGCATKRAGRIVKNTEWGHIVSRGGWSPNHEEVERIFREEAARLGIEKPPKPYLLFQNVNKGLTFTSIPPLIIVEPGKEWREVLRHELQHLFLWVKKGNGEFHHRH